MFQVDAKRISTIAVYSLFMLTGASIASPGALLPQLLTQWHLNDVGGGMLLFLFFAGSSLGGVAARGHLKWTLVAGCGISALAIYLLTFSFGRALLFFTSLSGFGLGLSMTSISLMRSRKHSKKRISELSRLNFVWAAGACLGPFLSVESVARFGLFHTLCLASASYALFGLGTVLLPLEATTEREVRQKSISQIKHTGIFVMMMIPIMTGLESSTGGWLTAYSRRNGQHHLGVAELVSIFWTALLLSRLTHSFQRVANRVAATLFVYPAIAVAGIILLAVSETIPLQMLGAAMIGWAIGPLYPMALALLLDESEVSNLGFLVAGVGGATLPLLTGLVSNYTHSIRAGLGALLLPGSILVALAWVSATRYLREFRGLNTVSQSSPGS